MSAQNANVSRAMLFDAGGNDYPDGRWGIELNATDYGLNFWKYNQFEKLHFQSILLLSNNGNVGIGNTNPQAKLDVNGSLKAKSANIIGALSAQSANISGAITAGGTLSAQTANVSGAITANTLNSQSAKISGRVCAQEVIVSLSGSPCWPDFVFDNNYNLLSLNEVEQYIKQNNRLPNIPSAQEVTENGIDLGEMQSKLLQKVEEMTLYILQQDKKITDLQNQINELKTK